ncbi:CGNR zinc finger domain-containing protein [Actinomycetospora termitidis]|uniref:CGNR zinc finger domain-containing protein n=1 Tax=Actinomycetospora termitidis TaxID=3053470 RepID=A0ABT7M9T6_9PSEU|nr:ABATE domain-containing protein [Actinomycetospora sp. Odt1-22]MDL5156178.1 CGNR zinc finger domain-containing protein [Actinomycetospora sp. Odt1-22]
MDDFVAGHPALDFVNTAGGPTRERDLDRLRTWDDLLAWCRTAGLVAEDVPVPDDPDAVLADLRALREDLHAFLTSGGAGSAVRAAVVEAYRQARPDPVEGWTVTVEEHGADLPALRIELAVGTLLAGPDLPRVGRCDRCSWVFLDPSPTRRRRWCSMATCGNRAKQERLRRQGR